MTTPHSPKDLERIYQKRFDGLTAYRQAVWRLLADDFFARWIPESSTILDLGCGYCEFINHIKARHRYAMDLNPQAERCASQGVQVLIQDCSSRWPLSDETLDVVFTSNFLEHLPSKAQLETTIGQAYRCLRAGGRLIALGPNIRHVPGAYWDFFDHHLPLTDLSVVEVLEKIGFNTERRISRFLPYSMSQGRTPPLWILRLYLRLSVAWRLFGKQFLVIARKPGTIGV